MVFCTVATQTPCLSLKVYAIHKESFFDGQLNNSHLLPFLRIILFHIRRMNIRWYSVIKLLEGNYRRKRLEKFCKIYPDLPKLSVLDVGGSPVIWKLLKQEFDILPQKIVLLNREKGELYGDFEHQVGDGCQLPYPDNSFDLIFSNSVIEHVGGSKDRHKFARECGRVGREIYIQTPNRWFPVEPHIFAFLIHWLPRSIYKKLSFLSILSILQFFNLTEQMKASEWISDINLLSKRELKGLFPGNSIIEERAFGLVKSFVVTSRKDNSL